MSPNPGSGGSPTVMGAREKALLYVRSGETQTGAERKGGRESAATLYVHEYVNYTLHVYIYMYVYTHYMYTHIKA